MRYLLLLPSILALTSAFAWGALGIEWWVPIPKGQEFSRGMLLFMLHLLPLAFSPLAVLYISHLNRTKP